MGEQLQKFEDGVKARVREIVSELIPEQMYNEIVQRTVEQFRTVELPSLVRAELTAIYKEKIREFISTPEFQAQWENGQQVAGEGVKKLLIESAPLVFASVMGGLAQSVIDQLRYKATQSY